jgi:hypothetical protein
MVASGTFGYGVEYAKVFDIQRLGGIVTKTTTIAPRRGNLPQRIDETPAGMLNSIGLQNIGTSALLKDLAPLYATWRVPVVVSILGSTVEEYGDCAARLEGAEGISGLELNISSPNATRGGMEFGQDPETAAAVTAAVVRNTTFPVIVKLTPNVADPRVVARAVIEAGAEWVPPRSRTPSPRSRCSKASKPTAATAASATSPSSRAPAGVPNDTALSRPRPPALGARRRRVGAGRLRPLLPFHLRLPRWPAGTRRGDLRHGLRPQHSPPRYAVGVSDEGELSDL